MSADVTRLLSRGRGRSPQATAGWRRTMVRGLRPNDLSGKAGEIAAELEERLERGEYRFGETLSIYTLARQFDASRQPVATAVLYLRSIGYLEVIPQVGCRVVSPGVDEVQDFFVLFAQTEGVIARFAAQRHAGEEGEQLLALAQEMSANTFVSRGDRAQMADDVSVFHDQISVMARSPHLVDRISYLRRLFRFYLSQQRERPDPVEGAPERLNGLRLALAQHIRDRDVSAVGAAVESYILDALADWSRVV